MQKFIILDRDGVINYDSPHYIKSPDEFIFIPGSLAALAALKQHGYTVVVVTNQSGVARGLYSLETLQVIHQKLLQGVTEAGGEIAKIYFCPHHPDEHCECRKPNVALFKQIAKDFNIDLTQTIMVGDRLSDLQAAQKIGARAALVQSGYTEEYKLLAQEMNATISNINLTKEPYCVYENLQQFVSSLIAEQSRNV